MDKGSSLGTAVLVVAAMIGFAFLMSYFEVGGSKYDDCTAGADYWGTGC